MDLQTNTGFAHAQSIETLPSAVNVERLATTTCAQKVLKQVEVDGRGMALDPFFSYVQSW